MRTSNPNFVIRWNLGKNVFAEIGPKKGDMYVRSSTLATQAIK